MALLTRVSRILGFVLLLSITTATVTYYMGLWDVSSFMVSCNSEPEPALCKGQ